MTHTFLWHDYETFGIDPRRDRPAQFAAIRTDAQLNIVGEPINLLCKPAPDYLPDPASCLVTGITPQQCLQSGVAEQAFAERIHAELAQPGTIGVGYNSIRFDDEFTRFLFWRNLIDPYGREWQNECGRWDLLDVMRLAHALRPDGIVWPKHEDGSTSFKLEHLSAANGLKHEAAHDALSDVYATIAVARLLQQQQPRLFDFALKLRSKHAVAQEMGLPADSQQAQPFLHVSGMLPVQYGCMAVMWPLASHPSNRNEVIAWDLRFNPQELASLSAADIRARLFVRADELPEGVQRLPIKTIHLNRSPMVVRNLNVLSPQQAERWHIDLSQAARHAEMARALPDMSSIWAEVFSRPDQLGDETGVDGGLYAGFVSTADRRKLEHLRTLPAADLADARTGFEDERLEEVFWRYRARNFPQTLSADEQQRWHAHCAARLIDGQDKARTVDDLLEALDTLYPDADVQGQTVLDALQDYAQEIVPDGAG
jgi:exodeoxyribonuclease-1